MVQASASSQGKIVVVPVEQSVCVPAHGTQTLPSAAKVSMSLLVHGFPSLQGNVD